jgi:hypothetical protein
MKNRERIILFTYLISTNFHTYNLGNAVNILNIQDEKTFCFMWQCILCILGEYTSPFYALNFVISGAKKAL